LLGLRYELVKMLGLPAPRLSIVLNDLGLALEQDDEVIRLIAVADEDIAHRDALLRPIAA